MKSPENIAFPSYGEPENGERSPAGRQGGRRAESTSKIANRYSLIGYQSL